MPKLLISGTAHELTEDVVTIGRAPDNIVVIEDPSVSGRHAQMELSGETYRLRDLGSTNGTRVNGIPIGETLLRFDDRVRFGAVEARFEADRGGSQPLPVLRQIEVQPAEASIAPADFENASPFPRRTRKDDPLRTVIFAAAALALLTFLGSMVAVLMMRPPPL